MKWLFLAWLSLSSPAMAGGLSVVVSKETKVPKASKLEISRIFLGKKAMLGGQKLKPVDYADENMPLVRAFRKYVLHKSRSKYKVYWSSRIFTGKGVPPKSVAKSQKQMIKYLIDNPGSIGVISTKRLTDDLREVYRHGKK